MKKSGRIIWMTACTVAAVIVASGDRAAASPAPAPGAATQRAAPHGPGSLAHPAVRMRGASTEAPGSRGASRAARVQPGDSERLARAKDLISEEQWAAAMPLLRAAAADPKEQNRDEALFWLAHSQNQAGDIAEAVDTVRRLQREHPSSRWNRPAYSLLIELAQKVGRDDVLWWTATPPVPPPPPPAAVAPAPPVPATAARPARPRPVPPPPPPAPLPPASWIPEAYLPDADLRVLALGRLIRTEASKAIPLLRMIALEGDDTGAARRAVFVLAQSRNPDAQMTVVDVAKLGPEPVQLAAVRELGRFGGPNISRELLQVYSMANRPVKEQVVVSLGEREDALSLFTIAQSESDGPLRDRAIMTLGRAGGGEQLRTLYSTARREARRAVIIGLFNAGDEDELIRIADREKDAALRAEVRSRLRLMGTPKARAYLDRVK